MHIIHKNSLHATNYKNAGQFSARRFVLPIRHFLSVVRNNACAPFPGTDTYSVAPSVVPSVSKAAAADAAASSPRYLAMIFS